MRLSAIIILLICVSCSHTIYVVRHAEKEVALPNSNGNVPLTAKGKVRAEEIKRIMKKKKIAAVYSTNTIRTISTAKPTADYFGLSVQIYGPRPDSAFITMIKASKKNTLIVGHSNTIDDVVNGLCGEKKVAGDLPDDEFNKLYVLKVKRKKIHFRETTIFNP
ncbi:MAG: histidine phosphatase family protein [Chitinophagaceae bacterium]